jgi:tetratricopeptide (TPR) repeat protein
MKSFLFAIGVVVTTLDSYANENLDAKNAPLFLPSSEAIELYFKNFETLAKSEKWNEILSQGTLALAAAEKANRPRDAAKICAQLTSTTFYLGDYPQALRYANRCHELSEEFEDPSLFLRALYLESAVYRAFGAKDAHYFRLAVDVGEQAVHLYSKSGIDDEPLKGKIYFNLGAAHADNPSGDLQKAASCYFTAIDCFKNSRANDDLVRTNIRLGKVHLLQKNYDLAQKVIDRIRPEITSERIAMHADYLEAQVKLATNDRETAMILIERGLARAKALSAKEDEQRFLSLYKDYL